MKNKNDKDIEKLVDKMMAEDALEIPSIDFTAKIMSAVLNPEAKKAPVYKPVISKRGWFIIFAGIIALFAFLTFNTNASATSQYFDFKAINFEKYLAPFSALKISSITSGVLLVATVMLFVQIFLLKNYLDKRLQK